MLAAILTGVTGSTVLVSSGTASAGATYNGECGTGYSVIDSIGLDGGKVFLTYSPASGKNCVVAIRDSAGGSGRLAADVSLAETASVGFAPGIAGGGGGVAPGIAGGAGIAPGIAGGAAGINGDFISGSPARRSEPKYVYAPDSCITWSGSIGRSHFEATSVHCG
ncbi:MULTISPECIES: hypothetical protein [Parafrankia]|uniref:hypothetical protein n=1 Tax=Parafrankia TaxID=2994362 RepID=UPI0012F95237|nr:MULTISPECIES: hypothetical protein [Parafrankia]MBE3202335.1 hypothetical protein [Parafrankia sp. CH37]